MKFNPLLLTGIFFLYFTITSAQITTVHYQEFSNGSLQNKDAIEIEIDNKLVFLSEQDAIIRNYIDYEKNETCSIIKYQDSLYRTGISFDSLPIGKLSGKCDTILGFTCMHKNYKYFSNSIDVYYTEEAGVAGGPYQTFLPNQKALVLKVVINGNRELLADTIYNFDRESSLDYPYHSANKITKAEFEELKIKSRYNTTHVFNNEQINFDPSLPQININDSLDHKTYRLSNGTIILKKISLHDDYSSGGYTYLDLKCRSNGDAYDRTGTVFAIFQESEISMLDAFRDSIGVLPSFFDNRNMEYHGYRLEKEYQPPVELMRFFTSFGAGHFNTKRVIANYPWFEEALYKQEISQLIPADTREFWIGVFIGNYDKGGHIVDLDLHFYPPFGEEAKTENWVLPLFNTVNIMEMSGQQYPRLFNNDTLEVFFDIPEGFETKELLFTSTGHGGWGNGDEFNPKLNQLLLDNKEIFKVVPWRTDCASYRLYNPASGNFGNGMSSSDFSRSNWCPGTLTPPYIIPLTGLKPGPHIIKVIIDQGEEEGNSFSAWSISGILTGTKNTEKQEKD